MENINEIVKEAVFMAIKEYDKVNKEKSRRKVIHNTRLILKNYIELNNHSRNAVYKIMTDIDELDGDNTTMYSEDEVFIESIKRSKFKTFIMINHIDMAMERVRENYYKAGSEYKYNALAMFYLNKKRKDDIAEELNCSTKSVSRWIKEVEEDIGINLFGINSIEYLLY